MHFEWDSEKEKTNIKKHGISFHTAQLVFTDNNHLEFYDEMHSTAKEERYIALGNIGKILFVVFTEKNNITRIISARPANTAERKLYYGNY
ncbi:MAG: BrnT family toxin [Spirochaetales bacterium]